MALHVHSEAGGFVVASENENVHHNSPRLALPRGPTTGFRVKGKNAKCNGGQVVTTQQPTESPQLPPMYSVEVVPQSITTPLNELNQISAKVLLVAQGCDAVDAHMLACLQAKAVQAVERAIITSMGEVAALAAMGQHEVGYTSGLHHGLKEGRALAEVLADTEKKAKAAETLEREVRLRAEINTLQDALDKAAEAVANSVDRALKAELEVTKMRNEQLGDLMAAVERSDITHETHPWEGVTESELDAWFDGLTHWTVAD